MIVLIYAVFASGKFIYAKFISFFYTFSGLVDENNIVTSDKAEEIGALIQQSLDHVSLTEASLQRKDQITNLQSLYSSIVVENEKVSINSLTLFLRLFMVVDRMPENEIEDYFYELSTYSMSLFKVGTMRTATKAKLKNFLLKMCLLPKLYQVLSALLLMEVHFYDFCKWKKNDRFGDVFQKYVDAVGKLGIDVVVFDG